MSWNYAELSKMAKVNGGPEKLVDSLINSGKRKMFPWIGVAALAGAVAVVAYQKINSNKKANPDTELEKAKQELIQGIKDYDAIHTEENIDLEDN